MTSNIAIVLPRNMHFGPARATAIDLCVRDYVLFSRYREQITVIGEEIEESYSDIYFKAFKKKA